MSIYVCKVCGYKKTVNESLNTLLGYPAGGMYDSTVIMPFYAMEFTTHGDDICPNCGRSVEWEILD